MFFIHKRKFRKVNNVWLHPEALSSYMIALVIDIIIVENGDISFSKLSDEADISNPLHYFMI